MNLAINARDAMPDGGRLIIETDRVTLNKTYCRRHTWAKPGQYVRLSMSDTGFGMDDETRQRIFEPFFTTKEVGKGTGLGLSVVYGIIRQHDGLIDVYSEVGHGTSFNIYLPVAEESAEAITGESEVTLRRGIETILVAEDEAELRELAQTVLVELGYTVLLAQDGQEAVEIFAAQHKQIDLVLLDMVMPRLGGREAYQQICKLNGIVPALFMTGYSAEMAASTFVADTDIMIMQKPYSIDELGRKVREALDQANG